MQSTSMDVGCLCPLCMSRGKQCLLELRLLARSAVAIIICVSQHELVPYGLWSVMGRRVSVEVEGGKSLSLLFSTFTSLTRTPNVTIHSPEIGHTKPLCLVFGPRPPQ